MLMPCWCCSGSSGEKNIASQSCAETGSTAAAKMQKLGRKNDLVVWLKLQPMQRRIYEASTISLICLFCALVLLSRLLMYLLAKALQSANEAFTQAFLNSTAIKAALNKTGSALAALTVLKKVRLLLLHGAFLYIC